MFLLVLAGTGGIYEAVASARALRRYPPPGERVDVGGFKLHIYCVGERQDSGYTVILESGWRGYALDWSLVQPRVVGSARVCAYDRAGYGWSEPGPGPRSARRMVVELHTLLQNSGEGGPYVLVGAGFGGLVAQMYAAEYPDQMAAIVLVDSLYGDWLSRMPYHVVNAQTRSLPIWAARRFLAHTGAFRLAGRLGLIKPPEGAQSFPPDVREMALALGYGASHHDVAYQERFAQNESLAQARAAGPIPEVPLAVLTRGLSDCWRPPGVSRVAQEEAEKAWRSRQVEMANSVLDSTLIVAEESGHAIPVEQPEAVVEAIEWAIAATRRSAC